MSEPILSPEMMDTWGEMSGKVGSRVLRLLYSEDEGDAVTVRVTRTRAPNGGSDFTFELVEEAPETPRESAVQRWLRWWSW